MNPAKYLLSLARRLGIAVIDATINFAKNETVVFGAFCTGLATTFALKLAEDAGITLPASALAYLAVTVGAISAVVIRQFVGSAAFVEKALQDAENKDNPPA